VPFFNEAEGIRELLAELRAAMDGLGADYEVLAVNDGSRDSTGAILDATADAWPQCRVLHFEKNCGQAAAILTGMMASIGPVVITLDGDGQNVPADIPKLLAALDGADLVCGIRAQRRDSWLRRKMSRLANAIRGRVLGDGVRDTGCALKAMRREVVGAMLPIRTLYSFIPALAVAAGFRVAELPVRHRERRGGQSSYGLRAFLWRPLVDMLGILWFKSRRCPAPVIQEKTSRP
jgi:glycosyltransferase involved in cell wall biosynthesis